MMSSESMPPPAAEPPLAAANRKTTAAAAAGGQRAPQEQQALKCPRCDSSNTKFCYYNNYSLSQPRHFCKTCRRYWTRGGALRNVPIGGGCRKSKKLKPSPTSPSPATSSRLLDPDGGLKFLSPPHHHHHPSQIEFQLGGLSLPKLHPATPGVFSQFISSGPGSGPPAFGLDLLGLGYPAAQPTTTSSASPTPASSVSLSSIESLSTINQEMHWKLQQQRLASLFYGGGGGGGEEKENKLQPPQGVIPDMGGVNLLHNLEVNNNNNNKDGSSAAKNTATTEWFFDHHHQGGYGLSNNNNHHHDHHVSSGVTTTVMTPAANTCHGNGVADQAAAGWADLHHQFAGLH